MSNRKIFLTAFFFVALVQLFVPAKMILDKENVLETGTEYKFRTAPIDPNDPFRGKYISLSYVENTVEIPNEKDWLRGELIYVLLSADQEGFAKIKTVSKEKPAGTHDFIKAKVSCVSGDGANELVIDYPFDRYYMEESKAPGAEQTYRQSLQDTNRITYALVRIKNGDAVLKDVIIDGASIGKLVTKTREMKK